MADYPADTYDRFMAPLERLGLRGWRRRLLRDVQPPVLEVGVGTGASLRWYADRQPVVAADREGKMARAALEKAAVLGRAAHMCQMDVQRLAFPDETFASVVTSLVFCSVADPLQGLRQIRRVLRPGGRLFMLEHVRPGHPVLGALADAFNVPWHAFTQECRLNRRTVENVAAAGFAVDWMEQKLFGAVNLIVANK